MRLRIEFFSFTLEYFLQTLTCFSRASGLKFLPHPSGHSSKLPSSFSAGGNTAYFLATAGNSSIGFNVGLYLGGG